MKKTLPTLGLICLLAPLNLWAAGQAEVHLYSLALRLQPATLKSLGLNYTLELTSDTPASTQPNGELAPLPAGAPSSHGSYYRLTGDIFFEPVYGTFFLNVPDASDTNTNGIPDFFEISQAVAPSTIEGAFDDFLQSGRVRTTWSRSADSATGTCRLTMDGYNLTFIHSFEIQEYGGVLRYATTATNVTGTMTLTNLAAPSQTLSGQTLFEKVSANRLKLLAGTWSNSAAQAVAFQGAAALDRDGKDFYDFFVFTDGDVSTSAEDYLIWLIKITDLNDGDGNGIPDLSDEPLPRRPALTLNRSGTNILLSISGAIGEVHQVEQTPSLSPSRWALAASLILTNDPQVVRLPGPTNATSFWRVKVP